ncbi:MAG: PIN domain-containing protein [Buchananella hordeovulneris]|nr:PIN domain-containing protein [Buchananella hordeovulneris]
MAVLDSCVLAPELLRHLLLGCGRAGLFAPRWTLRITGEVSATVRRARLGDPQQVRAELAGWGAQVLVRGYESLEAGIGLSDPADRHVVAAAMRCGAQVIVTANTRDFPAHVLARRGLLAQTPDDFLTSLTAPPGGAGVGGPAGTSSKTAESIASLARGLAEARGWSQKELGLALTRASLPTLARRLRAAATG